MFPRALPLGASLLVLLAPLSGAALAPTSSPWAPEEADALAPILAPETAVGPSFGVAEKKGHLRQASQETPPLPEPVARTLLRDCGTGADAGHQYDPTPMEGPATCRGYLSGGDPQDAYSLPVEGPALLSASVTVAGAPVVLCVFHAVNDLYETERCDEASEGSPGHTATYVAEPGTWHVLVEGWDGDATYDLAFAVHGWTTSGDCGATDASGQAAQATLLAFPSGCDASLDPVQDLADWYAVHLDAGQAATLSVAPDADLDADVCVYPAGNLSRPLDCSIRPVGDEDRVLLPGGGDYLVHVEWWDGAGPYALSLSPAASPDDCGTGTDAGTRHRSAPIAIPLACAGALDAAAGDTWDAYRFTLPGHAVRVDVTTRQEGTLACIYAAASSWPQHCTEGAAGDSWLAVRAAQPGTAWVVGILTEDGRDDYDLAITPFVPSAQDDCGSGRDAGAHGGSSVRMSGDAACAGTLLAGEGDHADAFTWTLPASVVETVVRSEQLSFTACVQHPGSQGYARGHCGTTETGELALETQMGAPGNVTVVLEPEGGAEAMAYELVVRVMPPVSDCGTGADAPDNRFGGNGARIEPPVLRCEGKLFPASGDWTDVYLVRAEAGQSIVIAFEAVEGSFWDVCIREEGSGLCMWPILPLGAPTPLAYPVADAGDYAIVVEGSGPATAAYRLSVVVLGGVAASLPAPG